MEERRLGQSADAAGAERISRREFLKRAAVDTAILGAPYVFIRNYAAAQQRKLRIMTWSHFVPAFDEWFDPFAERWGWERGIRVTVDHIRKSVYNPNTRKYYGFSDNWVPDLGDYLKSVWTAVGYSNGPSTWNDLLVAGNRIKQRFPEIQIPIGIGFSQDIDSNMATRAILWSFGASIQNANENVVLNSGQTIRAVEYGVRLFREVMNPAVLSWNAASNNQTLNARQTAYILNSISAYRTAQDNRLPVADDIYFVPALRGPGGRWVSEHVFPSFMGSVADKRVPVAQKPTEGRKWSTNIGHPGPANPAEGEIFDTYLIPDIFAQTTTGRVIGAGGRR